MQSTRSVEIWVGIFVALGFAALLMLSMKVSHLGDLFAEQGYAVTAEFNNIGGLKVKSPVKMSGVRIGRVTDIRYDDDIYKAIVTVHIEPQYDKIPTETTVSIFTAGLLGEQYIGLDAGSDEEYLTAGDQFDPGLTQSAVVLEQLIGQFLYNSGGTND
ncbi:MAG: outer membrane lipid asymmetry maintenance protein MlaD [Gammaproteobacteria bacterium]|nr:MAG: outer membrane lipid asymmetry maintenance protein MlaD [Gammaproteobacteria bacterium]RKZ36185.1 MAG: outer membrane lipid asymmetry maintenance protein MlaD [Gammaproteobacteria bacterium]RKZ73159.1 MAG: outer membrane lipid asymmetry maintenance protein MlaD [Gammaproteobacteria bacterium]